VRLIERRIGLLFLLFFSGLFLAGAKAAWLGVVRADGLGRAASTQQTARVVVPGVRGTVTDRNGVELAISEPATSVVATPYLVRDKVRAAERLAPILDRRASELLRVLSERGSGFAYLARQLPAARAEQAERLGLEGIEFVPEARRSYPRDWLASQLLGTVGTDNVGLAGLEYAHDRVLRGRAGERRLTKDARGLPIDLRETRRSRRGADVSLTIDTQIQDRTEDVLQQVGQAFRPRGATAVVMDPRNGELLALANWPRVDANDVSAAPPYARQNRATGAAYEPGSTFKALTVAGALQDDRVTPETSFTLPPQIRVADRVIGESHQRGTETLNTANILAQSSNVGAIRIGQRLGKRRFDHWVRAFGFGQRTGVDLPGEEGGIVPKVQDYSDSSIGNLPIGQGLAVTPMQMAAAYSAIANGGVLRAPHVIRSVDGKRSPAPQGRRVISARTATAVRIMLEGVLGPGGTASEASIPGYTLAGKTGTANKPDPATGGYSDSKYVASFVGFAPARRPRLLVSVMVDEPQGDIYGATVAAPAFQRITSFALPYLRIPPK